MVKIYEANGLPNTDVIGLSDPFCVVQLNNERYVTQTDCNNLSPYWGKVFQFTNIKDICDVLEITVYDENFDHKYDLLGRLKIPLLKIENNKKKWYMLKRKCLRSQARGTKPSIQLEMFFIYNEPLALLNIINTQRQEILYQQFSKPLHSPTHSVNRIKVVTTNIINIENIIETVKKYKDLTKKSYVGFDKIHCKTVRATRFLLIST